MVKCVGVPWFEFATPTPTSEVEATLSGAKLSWGTAIELADFCDFIVIMLAGEKEKIPVAPGFCAGDAAKIVCCPTEPPVDKTKNKCQINCQ